MTPVENFPIGFLFATTSAEWVSKKFVATTETVFELLRRVPIGGFQVFSSIPELLQSIRSTQP
jgi:hypothetical protein